MLKILNYILISFICALLLAACANPPQSLTDVASLFDPAGSSNVPVAYTPPPPATSPPILQLNPGGHSAIIKDIAFTPDGRYLVSASDDKTIRVWDWRNGTARLIRGQQGDGDEGKIYAMALSPDGRTVAVGGWMDKSTASEPCCGDIRLHDLATGQVLGLLRGHTSAISALAFSPDGQQLVSGSGDNTAIVWDVPNRRLLQRLEGHTDHIYAVAFSADGARVVTGSNDHSLRLWDASTGDLITPMLGHTDKVRAVAVAADGTIASGSKDHTIRLWDGGSGAFIRTLADQGTVVGSLSFSPDGQQLLSGVGSAPTQCHVYAVSSRQELHRYAGHDNAVIATAFTPDGQLVATAGGANQEIHLWDPRTGTLKQRLAGGGASTWAVGISADGARIAWGNTFNMQTQDINNKGHLEYQLPLAAPGLGSPTNITANFPTWQRAAPTHGDWSLQHVKGGNYGYDAILEIRHNAAVQARIERGSTDGYDHRAYTFTPDGATIISGGANGVLMAYDRAGTKLGEFVGHTGDVWAVAVSGDGRLLVSGSADQTVRLWNVATRELLLTVFHENLKNKNPTPRPPPLDRRGGEDLNLPPVKGGLRGVEGGDWVAWTPQGYYTASPNGERMVGWQINRGPDQTPDYIEAVQLRDKLYRPDILTQAIALGSAEQAIAQAAGTDFSIAELVTKQPPQFQILNPEDQTELSTPQVQVELDIPPQPLNTPVDRVDVLVNGSLVNGTLTAMRLGKTSLPIITGGQRKQYTVPLITGINNIKVVATNQIGATTRELSVVLKGRAEKVKGDLYLIAIGVSDYADDQLDLKFAAADAVAFARSLEQHTTGLYKQIHTTILATGPDGSPPTAAAIRTAFESATQAKGGDTIIFFIAGHGVNTSKGYRFLPQDAKNTNGVWDDATTILWSEIQFAITNTEGQRILFVDTCQSGNAINSRLINDAAASSVLVFSATDGNTPANERAELGHGVFTYAILQGLEGKANMIDDEYIMLKELDTYVSNLVPKLTEGYQVPTIHTPGGFSDFAFANK